MVVRHMAFTFALMGLVACSTISELKLGEPITSNNRLSARSLGAGECGLFVWTADEAKQFILFSQSNRQTGVWFNETEEIELNIQNQSGNIWQQQHDIIAYKDVDGAPIELRLKEAQAIRNGTRFKAGLLKHTSSEGWEVVTPVVGLATCQS